MPIFIEGSEDKKTNVVQRNGSSSQPAIYHRSIPTRKQQGGGESTSANTYTVGVTENGRNDTQQTGGKSRSHDMLIVALFSLFL